MTNESVIERRAVTGVPGLDTCPNPVAIRSTRTGEVKTIPCRSYRCDRCGPRKVRRFLARVHKGLSTPGLEVTLTAPSFCDETCRAPATEAAREKPAIETGRPCGVSVEPAEARAASGAPNGARRRHSRRCQLQIAAWNEEAGATWHRFMVALRRVFPGVEFLKVWEEQGRGALHVHAVMTGVPFIPASLLRRLSMAAGFGVQHHVSRVEPAFVRYLAKYVSKSLRDVPGDVHVRPWSSSRQWAPGWVPEVREPSPDGPWELYRGGGRLLGLSGSRPIERSVP